MPDLDPGAALRSQWSSSWQAAFLTPTTPRSGGCTCLHTACSHVGGQGTAQEHALSVYIQACWCDCIAEIHAPTSQEVDLQTQGLQVAPLQPRSAPLIRQSPRQAAAHTSILPHTLRPHPAGA